LADQTYRATGYEVIVVDDGSTDTTSRIADDVFPFRVRYILQDNRGDAAARNTGAAESTADLLVFLDDDMVADPGYLAAMIERCSLAQKLIVMGTTHLWIGEDGSTFQRLRGSMVSGRKKGPASFVDLCSNNMAMTRKTYSDVGMMQGLGFPGSDIWCDVDFAYRAYRAGYHFSRAQEAIAYEQDLNMQDLETASRRMEKVAFQAVRLFHRHPGLASRIPMFRDKMPISAHNDSPYLVGRKVARALSAWSPVLRGMESVAHLLERTVPDPVLLRLLYRWVISSYIYRGYHEGLREYGPVPTSGQEGAPGDV
jgi:glycosyltransferase involved in cell wall biosynthesis